MGGKGVPETRLREQQEIATREAQGRQSSGQHVWKVVGGVALAVGVALVLTSLHDIRRYIRMVRM